MVTLSHSILHKLIYISEHAEADIFPLTKNLAKSKRADLIAELNFAYILQAVAC